MVNEAGWERVERDTRGQVVTPTGVRLREQPQRQPSAPQGGRPAGPAPVRREAPRPQATQEQTSDRKLAWGLIIAGVTVLVLWAIVMVVAYNVVN